MSRVCLTRSLSPELAVAGTVNTMPEKTLDAFADHGDKQKARSDADSDTSEDTDDTRPPAAEG